MASPQACADLEKNGAVFARSLDDVPGGATVLIPAHGIAPGVRDEAAERGLNVIDATCPLVAGVQAEARRFAERGDQVVLIGQSGLAVLPAILGEAPDHAILAETRVGAGAVQVADPRRVSYVLVPGVPVEDTPIATAALRSRFPALRGPDPDGFCYAASDRAETVRTVAASSDLVLVLGTEDDPDTRHLTALARSNRAKANVIADVTEIIPSWLAGVSAVGLAESTAAAPGLAARVTEALSGLGPLSVTRRQVTTEVTGRPEVNPALG
jgi:4-hydroxy-3-methylbut-2-enyl diphosphate reductase